ncbi:MAG TPA: FkbM family methyltransferase [Pseudacidobacterium sp.]|jgi:hypothetical protein|nr:FkbM family methyltransferase [Pseudacidobacterium sp.]
MEIDFSCDLRAYLGIYEHELLPYFKQMVPRGAKCFDLGGRDGYDALMMANLSRGKVASFECEHSEAENMRQTFAKNPHLSIQVVESFVGSQCGDGHITIDRAARDLFVPDFIKMDIEGAEDQALEGGVKTLANYHPHLIVEVHGTEKEKRCISILQEFKYRITIVSQSWFLEDSGRHGNKTNRWITAYPGVA